MNTTMLIAVIGAVVAALAAGAAGWQAISAHRQRDAAELQNRLARSAAAEREAADRRAADAKEREHRQQELDTLRAATTAINATVRTVVVRYWDMVKVYENAVSLFSLFQGMQMMRDARNALDAAHNAFRSELLKSGHLNAGPAYAEALTATVELLDKLNKATFDDALSSPMNAFSAHRNKATRTIRGLLGELAVAAGKMEAAPSGWTIDDFPRS